MNSVNVKSSGYPESAYNQHSISVGYASKMEIVALGEVLWPDARTARPAVKRVASIILVFAFGRFQKRVGGCHFYTRDEVH